MTQKAKKHFGQNFLTDVRYQHKIVDAAQLSLTDTIVEIGPGRGALTQLMAPKVQRLICIEKDRDLIAPLHQEFSVYPSTHVINADFCFWDFKDLQKGIKVIGNIPYNVSTPIIEHLFHFQHLITEAILTVQLEFGQRLCAIEGSKDYGSLSCFTRFHCEPKILFRIPRHCFAPVPKVESCCVRLDFSKSQNHLCPTPQLLFKFIQTVFQQRRKNLLNALKPFGDADKVREALIKCHIDSNVRAEQISLSKFIMLYDALHL